MAARFLFTAALVLAAPAALIAASTSEIGDGSGMPAKNSGERSGEVTQDTSLDANGICQAALVENPTELFTLANGNKCRQYGYSCDCNDPIPCCCQESWSGGECPSCLGGTSNCECAAETMPCLRDADCCGGIGLTCHKGVCRFPAGKK